MPNPLRLPAHLLRRISVEADVDPRTVKKAVRGEPVQPMPLGRIARAMERNGLPPPLALDVVEGVVLSTGRGRAA